MTLATQIAALTLAVALTGCGNDYEAGRTKGYKEALYTIATTDKCVHSGCAMVCTWSDGNLFVFSSDESCQMRWEPQYPNKTGCSITYKDASREAK